MNEKTGDSANEQEPLDPQTRLTNALDRLIGHDDQWRVEPSRGCLTVTRGWPDGSADTLIILSPETAYGMREDPRRQQVWSVRGTVEQIVTAAQELPPPLTAGAPSEPIPEFRRDDLQ